jgi:toxin ParE1/3/4
VTRITWSAQARRDLEAIREYIAADSAHYAEVTTRKIFFSVERLANFPESGRIVPELNDPVIREVIVGRFRVVYRLRRDVIEVVTVFRATREMHDVI